MYVFCNFYCSPAKKHGSDPPLFWGLATTLSLARKLPQTWIEPLAPTQTKTRSLKQPWTWSSRGHGQAVDMAKSVIVDLSMFVDFRPYQSSLLFRVHGFDHDCVFIKCLCPWSFFSLLVFVVM